MAGDRRMASPVHRTSGPKLREIGPSVPQCAPVPSHVSRRALGPAVFRCRLWMAASISNCSAISRPCVGSGHIGRIPYHQPRPHHGSLISFFHLLQLERCFGFALQPVPEEKACHYMSAQQARKRLARALGAHRSSFHIPSFVPGSGKRKDWRSENPFSPFSPCPLSGLHFARPCYSERHSTWFTLLPCMDGSSIGVCIYVCTSRHPLSYKPSSPPPSPFPLFLPSTPLLSFLFFSSTPFSSPTSSFLLIFLLLLVLLLLLRFSLTLKPLFFHFANNRELPLSLAQFLTRSLSLAQFSHSLSFSLAQFLTRRLSLTNTDPTLHSLPFSPSSIPTLSAETMACRSIVLLVTFFCQVLFGVPGVTGVPNK